MTGTTEIGTIVHQNSSAIISDSDHVILPADATIRAVEETFFNFNSQLQTIPSTLTVDLSKCKFIEVVSLIYLIAVLVARSRAGFQTILRLPTLRRVRDFLRVWDFPKALSEALHRPFRSLVSENDRKYFGENDRAPASQVSYSCRLLDRLQSGRFFAITTFRIGEVVPDRVLLDETSRWKTGLVKAVIDKHLLGPADRLASHIIYEALTNAFRHPAATLIQSASHFVQSGDYFVLTFWDDGRSIVDTLRAALTAGKSVNAGVPISVFAKYNVRIEDSTGRCLLRRSISSQFRPTSDTDDAMLLVSAILPGITRDVDGAQHKVDKHLQEINPVFALPGMGLYVITHAVVDLYHGMLSIRTPNLFMNIKGIHQRKRGTAPQYGVKVRKYECTGADFLGNMVTIRLPLRKQPLEHP